LTDIGYEKKVGQDFCMIKRNSENQSGSTKHLTSSESDDRED